MQTRCPEGWGLFLLLCDKYSDEGRGDPGSEYHQTLEAYRQHHQECEQCHGRTVEFTELAMEERCPNILAVPDVKIPKTISAFIAMNIYYFIVAIAGSLGYS